MSIDKGWKENSEAVYILSVAASTLLLGDVATQTLYGPQGLKEFLSSSLQKRPNKVYKAGQFFN